MKAANIAWLTFVIVGMSAGQLLFKLAGRSVAEAESAVRGFLSPYMALALILYASMTIIWVWQLSQVDLSRAYPFMALTFVVVPLLSALALGETIGGYYWYGIGFIVVGVLICSWAGSA